MKYDEMKTRTYALGRISDTLGLFSTQGEWTEKDGYTVGEVSIQKTGATYTVTIRDNQWEVDDYEEPNKALRHVLQEHARQIGELMGVNYAIKYGRRQEAIDALSPYGAVDANRFRCEVKKRDDCILKLSPNNNGWAVDLTLDDTYARKGYPETDEPQEALDDFTDTFPELVRQFCEENDG